MPAPRPGRRRRRRRPPCDRASSSAAARRPERSRAGAAARGRRAGQGSRPRPCGPSTMAVTPTPGVEAKSSLCGTARPRSRAAATTARASGCSLGCSAAAARASTVLGQPGSRRGLDVGDARGALGERAGLVERDQVDLPNCSITTADFDQHAVAPGVRDGREQRRHRGEDHRAGRGDDHEGHRPQQRGLEGGAEGERDREQRQRGDDHADGVALLDLLDEQLGAAPWSRRPPRPSRRSARPRSPRPLPSTRTGGRRCR